MRTCEMIYKELYTIAFEHAMMANNGLDNSQRIANKFAVENTVNEWRKQWKK